MTVWGKIIGGFCGYLLTGGSLFGLILGLMIGHFFDRGLHRYWQHLRFHVGQQAQVQQIFFKTTFEVMGHIAKADGRVSETEIQAARNVMSRMGLNETMRQQAINYFTQGKQSEFNLDTVLTELINACHHNKILLRMFVETQAQAAMADGHLSAAKQQALQMICQRLGFAPLNFSFFEDLFNFQRNYQSNHQYQQNQYRQPGRNQWRLSDAYALLSISETASDADVKRAYRKLMSQHHPDKLVSKGLPEEMIKLATEKTQNIKAAYEQICAARGIQ